MHVYACIHAQTLDWFPHVWVSVIRKVRACWYSTLISEATLGAIILNNFNVQVFAPGHCKVLADFVQGSSLTEFRATSVKRKKDFSGRWKPQLAVTILHKILLRTGRRWEFYSNTFEHMANMFQIRYVRDQYLQDSDAPGPDPQEQNVYRTVALVLAQSCDQQQYFSRSCANVVSARRTSWCVFPAAKAIAFALPGIITTCWQSGKPRAGKREKKHSRYVNQQWFHAQI